PGLFWIRVAQDHDRDAYDDEREQRADVDHLPDLVDGRDAADDGREHTDEDGVFVRGAEFGMDGGKKFAREETVFSHGIEHAGLPEKHDEHDAGQTGQSTEGDDMGGGREAAIEKGTGYRGFNVDVLPVDHSGEHAGDGDVKKSADEERNDDADG